MTRKAITIHQPWAGFIALEMKRYETRGWPTNYRGAVAIHAGKNNDTLQWLAASVKLAKLMEVQPRPETDTLQYYFGLAGNESGQAWERGAIIAFADLVDCLPAQGLAFNGGLSQRELALGDFSHGRYGWKLENVRRLAEPIYCRGQQGLWDVPSDLLEMCRQR